MVSPAQLYSGKSSLALVRMHVGCLRCATGGWLQSRVTDTDACLGRRAASRLLSWAWPTV